MAHSRWLACLFVAPALGLLIMVLGLPLISSVLLSLQDVRFVGTTGSWVGVANYQKILSQSSFWFGLGLSLVWVVANALLQTCFALIAALVLNERFPGVRIARNWIMLSWIVPTIVVVIIWRWLLSSSGGVIMPLLMAMGLVQQPIGFFSTPWGAFATLVFINSWRWFPFMTLMLLAGLARIPSDLYESAQLDGASAIRRFTNITWPLLTPTLAVLCVVGTLLSFNVFDIIWLITAGGPAGGTGTLPVLIYETAFKSYRLSEAASISVIVTVLLISFALLTAHFLDRDRGTR